MLLPHLSDNELFDMTHLLNDPSREPIRTYLQALLDRDRNRAGTLISTLELTPKITDGISVLPGSFVSGGDSASRILLTIRAVGDVSWRFFKVRIAALQALAEKWPDETTRELLAQRAVEDDKDWVRSEAERLTTELAKRLEDSGR